MRFGQVFTLAALGATSIACASADKDGTGGADTGENGDASEQGVPDGMGVLDSADPDDVTADSEGPPDQSSPPDDASQPVCPSAVGLCTAEESHCGPSGTVEVCSFDAGPGCITHSTIDCATAVGSGSTCEAESPTQAACSTPPPPVCAGSEAACTVVESHCGPSGTVEICALDAELGCTAFRSVDCLESEGPGSICAADSPTLASCTSAAPAKECPGSEGLCPKKSSQCDATGKLNGCDYEEGGCLGSYSSNCAVDVGAGWICVADSPKVAKCKEAPVCPEAVEDCANKPVGSRCTGDEMLVTCKVNSERGCVESTVTSCGPSPVFFCNPMTIYGYADCDSLM